MFRGATYGVYAASARVSAPDCPPVNGLGYEVLLAARWLAGKPRGLCAIFLSIYFVKCFKKKRTRGLASPPTRVVICTNKITRPAQFHAAINGPATTVPFSRGEYDADTHCHFTPSYSANTTRLPV